MQESVGKFYLQRI